MSTSKSVPVLVVEDDEEIRALLQTLLADNGYMVYEAPDSVSALARLRTHPQPLVVVLDWWMPGLDGLRVLQAIADDAPIAKRHAFILLSASIDHYGVPLVPVPADVRVTIMSKPFDTDKLLAVVADEAAALTIQPPTTAGSPATAEPG